MVLLDLGNRDPCCPPLGRVIEDSPRTVGVSGRIPGCLHVYLR
jgi:hypothetical protein